MKKQKLSVGVIGAGGYAGITLVQILLRHPEAEISWIISEEAHRGKKIADLYPHLRGEIDLIYQTLEDLDKILDPADLIFLALPHGIGMNYVPKILEKGRKVIDLGADFRFADGSVFEKWYKTKHTAPDLLKEAIFGLPEIYREQIKSARLIGNPGCYPTASILALAPLVKEKVIDLDSIVVDAKSGISGAGRGVSLKTHFCERSEGLEAYAVTTHRHMGEIEYQISRISEYPTKITFVPHLIPLNRGILATCYAKIKNHPDKIGTKIKIMELFKNFYQQKPFVRILEDKLPNPKYVSGTNYCDIAVEVNECTNMVIVLSALDNLVKGAAGQAVQNMNLMYGFPEKTGLEQIAIFP